MATRTTTSENEKRNKNIREVSDGVSKSPTPRDRAPTTHHNSAEHKAGRESRLSRLPAKWKEVGWAALASCVALWAAYPPLGFDFLAWLAPLGLLWIIARDATPDRLGYFCIWLAGCVFWLAVLQGIRLAHWPLIFGWIALALYLAVYIPLFVSVARILHKRWQWSLAWAAPVAWTGMELWRSYLVTGYAATTLAHTQYLNPVVIQIADQVGGYGVSFIIMAAAVAVYRLIESGLLRRTPADVYDLVIPGALVFAMLGYGVWRLWDGDRLDAESKPLLRVALIQENTPSRFEYDADRLQRAWTRYAQTTSDALKERGPVDLVVWPESTFTALVPWMEDQTIERVPPEVEKTFDRSSLARLVGDYQDEFENKVLTLHHLMRLASSQSAEPTSLPHLLVGNDAVIFDDQRVSRCNAALLIDPMGTLRQRYEKIHLVMFGEYIPFAAALGLVEKFGLPETTPGRSAQAFDVNGVVLAPSICFESALPQFVSWQVRSLASQHKNPDVLVSITNDSWFRGSSILDHHLACEVLSAVEMRRPFLIAANTGLSAWIAGSGRIVRVTQRLQPEYIIAECTRDSRWGLSQLWGDLPGWCLGVICGLALLSVRRPRRRMRAFLSLPERSGTKS